MRLESSDLKIDCTFCPIRHSAICSRCEEDELVELNAIKFYKPIPAGQTIAIRGDRLDIIASIVSGVATLTRAIDDGRTQVTGLLLPSDYIGRPGRDTAPHDITAVTDLTLCCFHKRPFEELLARTPHLHERMLEMALDELDAAHEWMLLLGRKSAREKIASLLLLILRRSHIAGDGSASIELPLSRESIANYLGLTIETVSRQITALRKEGLIALEGTRKVVIPDPDALAAEAGETDA
ncbi:MAG: Crp/Fnr family transcriptional regulator [Pseudomonadota bacterium]